MKNILLIFLLSKILIFYSISSLFAQDFNIKTNSLDIINDKLVISYEFSDFEKKQKFEVWVIVTDNHGNKLVARTFSGDIGINIFAGKNKKIEWNYMNDKVIIHEEIGIEVKARLMTLNEIALQELTLSKTLAQSAIFPGWGLKSATQKKTFLLLGAATYISAGLGIYLNMESLNNYEAYKTSGVISSESDLYNKSIQQSNMSKVMLYSSAGIWATSMIWTLLKTQKLKKNQKNKNIFDYAYIIPTYNNQSKIKGLTFSYIF